MTYFLLSLHVWSHEVGQDYHNKTIIKNKHSICRVMGMIFERALAINCGWRLSVNHLFCLTTTCLEEPINRKFTLITFKVLLTIFKILLCQIFQIIFFSFQIKGMHWAYLTRWYWCSNEINCGAVTKKVDEGDTQTQTWSEIVGRTINFKNVRCISLKMNFRPREMSLFSSDFYMAFCVFCRGILMFYTIWLVFVITTIPYIWKNLKRKSAINARLSLPEKRKFRGRFYEKIKRR